MPPVSNWPGLQAPEVGPTPKLGNGRAREPKSVDPCHRLRQSFELCHFQISAADFRTVRCGEWIAYDSVGTGIAGKQRAVAAKERNRAICRIGNSLEMLLKLLRVNNAFHHAQELA